MPLEYLNADDGHRIALHSWPAQGQAQGALIWLHGMAEHGGRYAPLADALNAAGWHLYWPDHRGHGASVGDGELRGHCADQEGWQRHAQQRHRHEHLTHETAAPQRRASYVTTLEVLAP